MNKLFLLFALLLSSCGKKEEVVIQPQKSFAGNVSNPWAHRKVKELFVVVFKKNYSSEEWRHIFDLTKQMSEHKKTLRTIEGDESDEAGAIRSDLLRKNASILNELGGISVFMMNWSAQDENCKLVQDQSYQLKCKPRNRNNPLNGGLPSAVGPVEWVMPNPAKSDVKTAYLKLNLVKSATEESRLDYAIALRLKAERITETESWLKGDAVPVATSKFMGEGQQLTSEFFPYGYAELTLGD